MTPDPKTRWTVPADVMSLARLQEPLHRPMLAVLRASGVPLNADDPPKDPPVTGKTEADVAKLQAALDAERAAHKTAAKDAKDLKARLDKIEQADASELDKATKRADEAEARVATLTASVQRANLTSALADPKLGLVDANAAAALATGVEYDDDGMPKDVDKIAETLAGRYAFLKGEKPAPKPGDINPGGGAGGEGGGGPALTAEELAAAKAGNMSPEEFAHYKDPTAGPYVPAKT